jgi:hypothetical protein
VSFARLPARLPGNRQDNHFSVILDKRTKTERDSFFRFSKKGLQKNEIRCFGEFGLLFGKTFGKDEKKRRKDGRMMEGRKDERKKSPSLLPPPPPVAWSIIQRRRGITE